MEKIKVELEKRKNKVVEYLNKNGFDGYIITNPYNIFYMLDYFFVSSERPVVCMIDKEGKTSLAVPLLEEEEATRLKSIDNLITYFEYPGTFNLDEYIIEEFKSTNNTIENVVFDSLSFGKYNFYQNYLNNISVDNYISKIREIKSDLEVDYLKKAAKYADFIVGYGADHVEVGKSEIELLDQMTSATVAKMVNELDEIIYVPGGPAGGLIPSGERTSLPHALPSNRRLKNGDNLILSCGANYRGYRVECERTFIIGEPNSRKIKAFNVMSEAQELGISMMKPGVKCSKIDQEVLGYIEDSGFGEYIRHRTGHGKGLEEHEPPWVEKGDDTVLEKGMVLSSEPGIYIDGFAGFRHSDTVVVTNDKPLILTKYNKELEDMIL
jgi:Xaa-Pro dipeptidase